ncbi:MAG: hypothetical protein V4454_14460 [Pseudomonadota bacterium]
MHDKARVAALQRAIDQERIEDIRRAERFRELAAKVRAFRDGDGQAPTEAELNEWAEHTAKAAAVAERLDELPRPPGNPSPTHSRLNSSARSSPPSSPPSVPPEFADTATLASVDVPDSQRSPEVEWTETLAYALLELGTDAGKGAGDIEPLIRLAVGLWPRFGTRDPIEIAQEEFNKGGKA